MGLVENVLDRNFTPDAPDQVWVTDITYIRTHEGWLFLAAVMDLYSRQIVGWATQSTMTSDLVAEGADCSGLEAKAGAGADGAFRTRAASSPAAPGSRSSNRIGWYRA